MKIVRFLTLSTAMSVIVTMVHAADEPVIKEEGASFSFFNPTLLRAEIGTMGYGAAISYSANPYIAVTFGYSSGGLYWDHHVKYGDINYNLDMDQNSVYLNAEIRPWANAFYVAAGASYMDQEYGLSASGHPIQIAGTTTAYNSLSVDVKFDQHLAPYLGLGFSPDINNQWGVFAEIGTYYMADPAIMNVRINGSSYTGGDAVLDSHLNEIRKDHQYEWLLVAKLGLNYRF